MPHHSAASFGVGSHRPVYLWAGPGTIRMNQLKFMGAEVDEAVHLEAHTPAGAQRMVEAGFNWAYLMYDWGFPPEVEQEDWDSFRQAVAVYHAAGIKVFGYVQLSNCAYAGSYREKDWYAQDSSGRPFYYYTGRYMTCWSHPGWLDHLQEMTAGVTAAGADGVFYDNPWHASQPLHLEGAWLGAAGCFCPRCREAYAAAGGGKIPVQLNPERDEASRRYLKWRANQVTRRMEELARYARGLNPNSLVSANNLDVVMRASYLIYGIDFANLAKVQDVMMIENFCLPRWEPGKDQPRLVNNALTLHTATALAGDTPVSTDPYDKGIGFDEVYSPRRLQQGIAEAAAAGAPMVVKGTEYVEGGRFTLLTAPNYHAQREAVRIYHRWLAEHARLYQGRRNAAQIGLLHPGDVLWQAWDQTAPLYFGAGQALLKAGLPWRVVRRDSDLGGLDALLTFGPDPNLDSPGMDSPEMASREILSQEIPFPGIRKVHVPGLPGWDALRPGLFARHPRWKPPAAALLLELYRAYFRYRLVRRLGDRLGLADLVLQSPHFRMPPHGAIQALLNALGPLPYPRVKAKIPVLCEHWSGPEGEQVHGELVHLVNYAAERQTVQVEFGRCVRGQVLSPDRGDIGRAFSGETLSLEMDVYAIIGFDE